jgi:hypothetical protein
MMWIVKENTCTACSGEDNSSNYRRHTAPKKKLFLTGKVVEDDYLFDLRFSRGIAIVTKNL